MFQRTPNWCAPLHNDRIGEEEMRRLRARYPEIFARCNDTPGRFIHAPDPRATHEVTSEEREDFWEKLYGEPGLGIWQGNFRDILVDRQANALMSDFIARKIRQRVKDPAMAEKLIMKTKASAPAACRLRRITTRPTISPMSSSSTSTRRRSSESR